MIPRPRAEAIRRRLLAWFDRARRDLPWRGADPYGVWLSEVMLQQTQVKTVLPYWKRFRERFPTLPALAAADDDEVLSLWSGLGYYARCRNLLRAARAIVERHGGELPASLEALRELPGFGPYTAGAVASIAFGIPAPIVDGNAARVLARLFLVEGDPAGKAARDRHWALAAALVDPRRPGDFNQALMELGATVCGRDPPCPRCPLVTLCAARAAGREREVPRPRPRANRRAVTLAAAVVVRRGAILFTRREGEGLFGGLWELPSAEVGPGGDAAKILAGALASRLGITAKGATPLGTVRHVLTHRELTVTAYRCRASGALVPASGQARFMSLGELSKVGVASLTGKLLATAGLFPRGRPG
jgi:A/G-specific adenine glycosylase